MGPQVMKLLLLIGVLLIIHYPRCEAQCGLLGRIAGRCNNYQYPYPYAYGAYGAPGYAPLGYAAPYVQPGYVAPGYAVPYYG
ncbi:hypothetical protein ACLKA7_004162 [Drosophila subpalustris]